MDAVKFLKEKQRMCESFGTTCTGCEINRENPKNMYCSTYIKKHPEQVVTIVERWSKEHPRKTFLQDFLEKFPKALIGCDGTPTICASKLGYTGVRFCDYTKGCYNCWHRPMEEE